MTSWLARVVALAQTAESRKRWAYGLLAAVLEPTPPTSAVLPVPQVRLAAARRTVETQLKSIRRAAELGAMIAAGSDSGAVGVMHGAGTETEYRLLRSAGLTDAQLEKANRALAERFTRR